MAAPRANGTPGVQRTQGAQVARDRNARRGAGSRSGLRLNPNGRRARTPKPLEQLAVLDFEGAPRRRYARPGPLRFYCGDVG